jgi:hypothetical protein
VLGGHPRLRDAIRVPEMLVGVDEHGVGCGSRGEEVDAARPASGDYLAVAFVMSDVPVSTFFGTTLPRTAL